LQKTLTDLQPADSEAGVDDGRVGPAENVKNALGRLSDMMVS
jgi:hypothetical protein